MITLRKYDDVEKRIHMDELYCAFYICTKCSGDVTEWNNYCPNCGEKIEWVNENDN